MIRDHPDKASRESPVFRKKGQQLNYLKIGPGYSVDPRFDRFRYTEVQFINFRDGRNVTTVSFTI